MLERQRAVDEHVDKLRRSVRNLRRNKEISGNLITVYNNSSLPQKSQVKSSGFYYSNKNQQQRSGETNIYMDSSDTGRRERLRSQNDDIDIGIGRVIQGTSKEVSMMLRVTEEK